VGPNVPAAYSKSLLYLVSRALEADHKTPISRHAEDLEGPSSVQERRHLQPSTLERHDRLGTHGSFDNNLDEVNLALRRILRRAPAHAVTNLKGF
jgi:hypothetical protein